MVGAMDDHVQRNMKSVTHGGSGLYKTVYVRWSNYYTHSPNTKSMTQGSLGFQVP